MQIVDGVEPTQDDGKIILWDRYSDNDSLVSILDFQNSYFEETRKEFLCFVHNFGEYSINGHLL